LFSVKITNSTVFFKNKNVEETGNIFDMLLRLVNEKKEY